MSAAILASLMKPREVTALRFIEGFGHRYRPLNHAYVHPSTARTLAKLDMINMQVDESGVRLVKITPLGRAVLAASDES